MKSWGKRLVGVFFGGKGSSARNTPRPARTRRVALEPLEERQMLSAAQEVVVTELTGLTDAVVLGEFNGEVYFRADDGIVGKELWKLDASGDVSLVADIADGVASSFPQTLTAYGDEIAYFVADDGITGCELWKLDPDGNVSLVADIKDGSTSSWPQDLILTESGTLFFTAYEYGTTRKLWMLDESGGVSCVTGGVNLEDLTVWGDGVYFLDVTYDEDIVAESVLWHVDGSGNLSSLEFAKARDIEVFEDELYVGATLAYGDHGLWKIDASGEMTKVWSGNYGDSYFGSNASSLYVTDTHLYFSAFGKATICRIDVAGEVETLLEGSTYSWIEEVLSVRPFNGDLYFVGQPEDIDPEDSSVPSEQLYCYDGDALTRLTSESLDNLTATSNALYFTSTDEDTGNEVVYRIGSDGEPAVVTNQECDSLLGCNDVVYFTCHDEGDAYELWKIVDVDAEDLGVIDYREVADQSLAEGERLYGFSTTRAGLLTIEVAAASTEETVNVTLYDEFDALIETAQLVDGEARFDYEAVAAGEAFQLLLTGANTSVNLRLCNLVAQSGTTVNVFDTAGTDAYLFAITNTFDVTANGVEYTFDDATEFNFTSTAGDDTVELVDSDGDDTLTVSPTEMAMSGTTGGGVTYSVSAEGFRYSHAYARVGGNDTAHFVGSEQKERMKAYEGLVKLMGGQYYARAKFFESVDVAMGDGEDTAVVLASGGADVLWAMKEALKVSHNVSLAESERPDFDGMSYDVSVTGCEWIVARGGGADDWVQLHDSALNDVLIAKPHKVLMMNAPRTEDDVARGEEYKITVRGYTNVSAVADQGGDYDVAKLYDSSESGTDTWAADYVDGQTWSAMSSPSRLLYEVLAFEQVGGYGFNGGLGEDHGTNQRDHDGDVDFVFEYGYWEDAPTTSRPVAGSWWNGRESLWL